ncbi:MAG: glycosyltransferase family 9 protein [Bryobacteraceae bacterium]
MKARAKLLDRLPAGTRVLVIRLRSLGDCVLTTPALELLKRHRPDLRVAVMVEERFRAVFEGNPDVEATLAPKPGAALGWRARLCLNLHGGPRSAWLTAASLARWRAGFGHYRYRWLYNLRVPTAQEILGVRRKVHTAEHIASAMFYLGVPRDEVPRARLFAQPGPRSRGRPYAVIHPLASSPSKTWPAERFLGIARRIEQEWDWEPVFIAGPGEDLSAFASYRCVKGASLAEVKALLAGAELFVGNDSGPAHMAAALGRPVLVIFGDSDVEVWRPWKTVNEIVVARGGIEKVSEAEVFGALLRLRMAA